MKSLLLIFIVLLSKFFCYGDGWIQKADYGGDGTWGAVSFSINGKGYVGTGIVGSKKDFWQYDSLTDVWTQVADIAGKGRVFAVAFSIGSNGYVGTGNINTSTGETTDDFWEYNSVSNTWAQKANFSGGKRQEGVGFSITNKGYIACGYNLNCKMDFWEYNPSLDVWSQKADYGGGAICGVTGFVIGDKGYIGTGRDNNLIYKQDFWEYDPSTNVWTELSQFPGISRGGGIGFSINGVGYLGLGYTYSGGQKWLKDFWMYDVANDSWVQKTSIPGPGLQGAVGFSIGNKGYVGTGTDSVYVYHKEFWEYTADTATSIEVVKDDSHLLIYPNPISSSSAISFSLKENSVVCIDLYKSNGKKVKQLLNKELQTGNHQMSFNRENLFAGIYLLQLRINKETIVKKIIIE